MYQIESIANIIHQANLGVLGVDMFLYTVPAEVQNCIILYPSNDPPLIEPDTPGYFIGKFQTIVRDSVYQNGLVKCKALSSTLTLFNKDTDLAFFKYIRPMMQARVYRRSDSGLIEFSITYDTRFIAK